MLGQVTSSLNTTTVNAETTDTTTSSASSTPSAKTLTSIPTPANLYITINEKYVPYNAKGKATVLSYSTKAGKYSVSYFFKDAQNNITPTSANVTVDSSNITAKNSTIENGNPWDSNNNIDPVTTKMTADEISAAIKVILPKHLSL